jgi:DNA repair protein RadC
MKPQDTQLSLWSTTKRRVKKDYSFTSRPSDIFPVGAFELSVSYSRRAEKRQRITNSVDSADFARKFCYDDRTIEHHEYFYVLLCDFSHHVFAYKKISEGGVAGTVADPKLIFQVALLSHASRIVLLHNHPSGNKKPSDADITLTKKLRLCAEMLDMVILDHVILTVDSYFSFADEGLL